MKQATSEHTTTRQSERTAQQDASAGPNAISIAPPAYEIDFVDRDLANAAPIQGSSGPSKRKSETPGDTNSPVPPLSIQAKHIVTAADDKYEREADQIARQVVSQSGQFSKPPMSQTEKGKHQDSKKNPGPVRLNVQRSGGTGGFAAPPQVERGINQAQGGGTSLPKTLRNSMEQAFRADFSRVRLHTDGRADQLNRDIQAKAFTQNQDIFFRRGEYDPGSSRGQELIAHELTHTIQQGEATNIQRVAGNPAALDEEKYAVVAPGESITYTDLIGGCLTVTVTFQNGGGAGVHLALNEQGRTQWEDFMAAIAGQNITQINLNSDMLGEDQGWRVKYDPVNYTPETDYYRPMSTQTLMRSLGKQEEELAPLGWWPYQINDWFKQALGCQNLIPSGTTTVAQHLTVIVAKTVSMGDPGFEIV